MTPSELQQIKDQYTEARDDPAALARLNAKVLLTLLEYQVTARPSEHSPSEAEEILRRLKKFDTAKDTIVGIRGGSMADAFAVVEERDQMVSHIVMRPKRFLDIRKHCRDIFDPNSRVFDLRLGFQGCFWGATVFTTTEVKDDSVYLLGEKPTGEPGDTIRFVVSDAGPA